MSGWYRFLRGLLTPIFYVVFRMKFINCDNLPKDKGVIVCCNHISNADAIIFAIGCKSRQIRFMAKEELFKTKFTNWLFRSVGAFPIKRGKGDTEGINVAVNMIKDGDVMGIYPEGTRSKDGVPLRPKAGVALIANATKADVIPFSIYTKGGKVRPFRRVYLRGGELIKNSELGITSGTPSELRSASRLIMDRINALTEQTKKEYDL